MAVYQEAFYIAPDILKMVEAGQYRIYGGVVRWAVGNKKGQIVKHLKPIDPIKNDAAKNVAAKALNVVKQNKVGAIVVGVGAAVAVGGGIAYKTIKERKNNHEAKEVVHFKKTLSRYMKAISKGNLTLELINEMSDALDALKAFSDKKNVRIELSFSEINDIVSAINQYTERLASNNSIELNDEERATSKRENNLLDFQKCLKAQKRIFEEAA